MNSTILFISVFFVLISIGENEIQITTSKNTKGIHDTTCKDPTHCPSIANKLPRKDKENNFEGSKIGASIQNSETIRISDAFKDNKPNENPIPSNININEENKEATNNKLEYKQNDEKKSTSRVSKDNGKESRIEENERQRDYDSKDPSSLHEVNNVKSKLTVEEKITSKDSKGQEKKSRNEENNSQKDHRTKNDKSLNDISNSYAKLKKMNQNHDSGKTKIELKLKSNKGDLEESTPTLLDRGVPDNSVNTLSLDQEDSISKKKEEMMELPPMKRREQDTIEGAKMEEATVKETTRADETDCKENGECVENNIEMTKINSDFNGNSMNIPIKDGVSENHLSRNESLEAWVLKRLNLLEEKLLYLFNRFGIMMNQLSNHLCSSLSEVWVKVAEITGNIQIRMYESKMLQITWINMKGLLTLFAFGCIHAGLFYVLSYIPETVLDYFEQLDELARAKGRIVFALVMLIFFLGYRSSLWFWMYFILLIGFYYWSGHVVHSDTQVLNNIKTRLISANKHLKKD